MKVTIELTEDDNINAHMKAEDLALFVWHFKNYLRNLNKHCSDTKEAHIENVYEHFLDELHSRDLTVFVE